MTIPPLETRDDARDLPAVRAACAAMSAGKPRAAAGAEEAS